jgi:hypothetical protein
MTCPLKIPRAGNTGKEDAMRSWSSWGLIVALTFGVLSFGPGSGPSWAQGKTSSPMTPVELVATYDQLADAILAVKQTEANLIRSILGSTYAHARVEMDRSRRALRDGDTKTARASLENLATAVGQLATEGDNAVAGIRKRLLEGGHHHNAKGEAEGIFDPGFVIVTRTAKKAFLDSSRSLGQLARDPNADALEAEWAKVQATWKGLMESES